ncbi:MAG TPA: methyltransferase domain-containing protein [Dermatophilaceae bacterium]|nr:methyltransferase domain-containing protein [Actinomycetales bacterium]HMT31362.1 methyltransferase domain-containing protein [Dermatophilaceae bacterium]HMT89901.1 methyltransferase domain-containing protein [Dermatophilaceae bacterium]
MDELDEAFDAGARRYDLLVGLNPGYHRHLRSAARTLVEQTPAGGLIADLGCGSGLSTRALLQAGATQVMGVDASAGMLRAAQAKSWPGGVRFLHSPAQDLAQVLRDRGEGPLDGAFAAYLLRNVPEAQRLDFLRALHAALRPGATVVLQDYSLAPGRRPLATWRLVCRTVIKPLATAVDGNAELYDYLEESVVTNWSPARIAAAMTEAGFTDVLVRTVPGWQRGILHDIRARAGGARA